MEATLIYPHQLFAEHPSVQKGRAIYLIEDIEKILRRAAEGVEDREVGADERSETDGHEDAS